MEISKKMDKAAGIIRALAKAGINAAIALEVLPKLNPVFQGSWFGSLFDSLGGGEVLHHVISDITGTTGLAILDAILAGEREIPKVLAELRDWRSRASEETIMKSLVGDYRDEHLFTLRQSLVAYRHYQGLVGEVNKKAAQLMSELPAKVDHTQEPIPEARNPRKTSYRNEPTGLREHLHVAFGSTSLRCRALTP